MSTYLQKELASFGLTTSESAIYLYLLQEGISTPPAIATATGIARTNTYHILERLVHKQLVVVQTKGKRKAYLANDPDALLQSVEQKRIHIQRMIPDLRAMYSSSKHKPKIFFYEGAHEVKKIYMQTYQAKEIFAIGSALQLNRLDANFQKTYFSELKKRNIFFKDILAQESEEMAVKYSQVMKGLYDVSYLPHFAKDQPTDILLWENHIALITLEEPIFGTVIASPTLYNTFRMLFDVIFQSNRK